mmetsp:Transcript_31519/g.57937  ORF Transcript_31519/g.57937 Transcript_31519/m.57937 type:complete len:321 (+) Transcript_31519:149-1111(+)
MKCSARLFVALFSIALGLQTHSSEHQGWVVPVVAESVFQPAEQALRGSETILKEEELVQAARVERMRRFMMQCLLFPERLQVSHRISVEVPYTNYEEEVLTFPERRPRTFNVIMATFKTWLADLIVQFGQVKTHGAAGVDWRRSACFAAFGFLYVGVMQWFFYVTIFTVLCPHAIEFANASWEVKLHDHDGRIDLVKQVCYDNFLLQAFVYFPVFYTLKELMQMGLAGALKTNVFRTALSKYKENILQDNLTSCAVWLPLDFVVFAAPIYMRLPLDHMVSFLWTMLLSFARGGTSDKFSSSKADGASRAQEDVAAAESSG